MRVHVLHRESKANQRNFTTHSGFGSPDPAQSSIGCCGGLFFFSLSQRYLSFLQLDKPKACSAYLYPGPNLRSNHDAVGTPSGEKEPCERRERN